ncbi:MAG: pitrilysin family protein [Chloroflexota bacterium]
MSYPDSQNIFRQTLANGITVLVYENFASQSFVLEGVVRAGALAETAAQAGLANMTAALLMRGTTSRDHEEIYEALEAVGLMLGFSGGRHLTDFAGQGLVEDLDLLLELLAQSLRQPTFTERQVLQVRNHILTDLHIRANDTRRLASLIFNQTLYQDHPYGISAQGYFETVPHLTAADLADFHSRYYGPAGMIITLVGAVKAEVALAKITAVLGDWQNEQQQPLPPVPAAPRPDNFTQVYTPLPAKSQADLIMGLPGPPRCAPDYLDASLMNTILGVFGMMGRIGQSVREEQGLAYYAYSSLQGGLGPAPWLAAAGVSPDKMTQAVSSIRQEIERIQNEPVSSEELADSQTYRIGSMPMSLETNSGLTDVICDMELYGLGLDFLQQYPDLIRSISVERVQAAAQKYLSSEQLVLSTAGPTI